MARWSPARTTQQWNPQDEVDDLNNEFYSTRMGMLLDSGAGRYFQADASSLVELAQSPLSENDMLETLVMANDQVRMNQLKQSFENMPKQMQEPQFLLLPKNMQDLLVGSGYELPSDKKKGLFERITTWDWPLIPEEHLISKLGGGRTVAGGLVSAGLAVPRAVGFGLGKVVGTGWEGLMKFSRFALHLQRSGAWLAEDSQWGNFYNPKRWWKSWQETEIESNSYSKPAMDEATNLIGSENARLLGMYLSSPQRLYDYFEGVLRAPAMSLV